MTETNGIVTAEHNPPRKWSNEWFNTDEGIVFMRDMYLQELVGVLRHHARTIEEEIDKLIVGSDLGALGRDVIGLSDILLPWAEAEMRKL